MMKRIAFRLATWGLGIAALLAASNQAARAELFSYASTVNVTTDGSAPAGSGGGGSAVATIMGGTLTYTANSAAGPLDATQPGGADVNFGAITFAPGASTTSDPYSVNFNYQVVFTDMPSGQIRTVNFTGTESGNARGNAASINSDFNVFAVAPTSFSIGASTFDVTFKSRTGPGSGGSPGALQGNLRLRAVPEPGSVALLGVGLVGAFGIYHRRRARTA